MSWRAWQQLHTDIAWQPVAPGPEQAWCAGLARGLCGLQSGSEQS